MVRKEFFCVTSGLSGVSSNPNLLLLKEACKRRGVTFTRLDIPQGVYSYKEVPTLGKGGLYRLSVSARCEQFANALLIRNPHLKTFKLPNTPRYSSSLWAEVMAGEQNEISVIPTLYNVTPFVTTQLIDKINRLLGGFPIILKQSGGSHGTGVMFIESETSLRTLLPHLVVSEESIGFVFRKYIAHATHYRVTVLGGECLGVIKCLPQTGDIRTNAVATPSVVVAEISKEWKEMAIHAVKNKGVVFGGVDLLIAEDDTPYLAEVNTPCSFFRSQRETRNDIAQALVGYLCGID